MKTNALDELGTTRLRIWLWPPGIGSKFPLTTVGAQRMSASMACRLGTRFMRLRVDRP